MGHYNNNHHESDHKSDLRGSIQIYKQISQNANKIGPNNKGQKPY